MVNQKFEAKHYFAAAKHRDINEFLAETCEKHGIRSGTISAIGMVRDLTLGFWNTDAKKYEEYQANEISELVSLTGDISLLDGKPFFHIHLVISDKNGKTTGGHLIKGTIYYSEISIVAYEKPLLSRKLDDETGLKIISGLS
ncbi:MAG: DUF296 domain-containing protein [Rickettsiales bacterium]|nr:DUF296 domain-containing protein [Rickettsiales bacterium]